MANKRNLAASKLSNDLSKTDTMLYIEYTDQDIFPETPFFITVTPAGVLSNSQNSEIMEVTSRSMHLFTVKRAMRGTSAKDFSQGAIVVNAIYTEDLETPALTKVKTGDWTKVVHPGGKTVYFFNGKIRKNTGSRDWAEDVYYILPDGIWFDNSHMSFSGTAACALASIVWNVALIGNTNRIRMNRANVAGYSVNEDTYFHFILTIYPK